MGLWPRAATAAVIVAAILALPGAAAQDDELPGIIGSDDRLALSSESWPWTAIGRVNKANGGFCTGTLVAPRLVLTAAHCVYDRELGHFVAPDDLHFVAGYNRGEFVGHAVGSAVTVADGFDPAGPETVGMLAADWAFIELAEPVDVAPVPWQVEDLATLAAGAPGTMLVHAGYGQDREHMLSIDRGCGIRGGSPRADLLFHGCDATRGDSGSPLLRLSSDGAAVVGLVVAVVQVDGEELGAAVPAASFAATAAALAEPAEAFPQP